MNLRTDMPPEGKPFILFLYRPVRPCRIPASINVTSQLMEHIDRSAPSPYAWAGIAELVNDHGSLCFVMAGTGKSEADGIEIEMDRGLRWAWAEIDDMRHGTVPWEGRES